MFLCELRVLEMMVQSMQMYERRQDSGWWQVAGYECCGLGEKSLWDGDVRKGEDEALDMKTSGYQIWVSTKEEAYLNSGCYETTARRQDSF